jgi:hypothetical protein
VLPLPPGCHPLAYGTSLLRTAAVKWGAAAKRNAPRINGIAWSGISWPHRGCFGFEGRMPLQLPREPTRSTLSMAHWCVSAQGPPGPVGSWDVDAGETPPRT